MELSHLKSFITVAKKANLTTAAEELGTTQPNLGRQMTALSKEVGLTLFNRHSRGIVLTREGEQFLDLCRTMIGEFTQRISSIQEKLADPQGILKVTAGTGVLQKIIPQLTTFCKLHPQIDFCFSSNTDVLDFKMGIVDVGIIPKKISDPDVVQHHLYNTIVRVYAAPSYLAKHSKPCDFKDLQEHKLIVYVGNNAETMHTFNLHINYEKTRDLVYRHFIEINNGIALRDTLLEGLGIGSFWYDREILEKNLLVDIFPNEPDHQVPYYFTYHRRLKESPKIYAFHQLMKGIKEVWERPPKP